MFKNCEILDLDKIIDQKPSFTKDIKNLPEEFFNFDQFEYKLNFEDLYEDWYLDQIYGGFGASISKESFTKRLVKKHMKWVFNSYTLRKKYKTYQIKYEEKKKANKEIQALSKKLAPEVVKAILPKSIK